jgi:hypothetical protein
VNALIVASIHTFGQKINLHPHIHCLVTEGGEDCEGTFHHLAEFQDSLLAEFFKREVFALLLGEELISEAVVEKIAGWSHSGFSVHSKIREGISFLTAMAERASLCRFTHPTIVGKHKS